MKKLDDLMQQLIGYGWEVENAQRRVNGAEAKLLDARQQLKFDQTQLESAVKQAAWVKNQIRLLLRRKPNHGR